jgi:hypothetical protein
VHDYQSDEYAKNEEMKPIRWSRSIFVRVGAGVALVALAALMVFAQSAREASRDAYRSAYQAWHEADPNLEHDAATASEPIGAQADRVAAEAAHYYAERRAFLDRFSHETAQKLAWLEAPPPEAGPGRSIGASNFVATQSAAVRKAIDNFAGDPDKGIQQVRMMLTRENIALIALGASQVERDKATAEADAALAAVEQAWHKASDLDREAAAGFAKPLASLDQEAPAWADYYRTFSDAARAATSDTGRVTSDTSSRVISDAPPRATADASQRAASDGSRVATPDTPRGATADGARTTTPDPDPAIASRPAEPSVRPAITPVPLIRYTGDWQYPLADGFYHGPQPEFIDLEVREEDGHCTGQMVARFKLPAGNNDDPILRFEFKGDFQNTRGQRFTLVTGDGAQGTIDLIPGPAFNLLEINVQIAARPGKIHQANMLLVKK